MNGQKENNADGVVAGKIQTAKDAKDANGILVFIFAWFAWLAVETQNRAPPGAAIRKAVAAFSPALGFSKRSAVRRGIFVATETKNSFKLRQVRNMPPRRGWGFWRRGGLQRFRSGWSFAEGFHLHCEDRVGLRKFFKLKPQNLGDDVIIGWLEFWR